MENLWTRSEPTTPTAPRAAQVSSKQSSTRIVVMETAADSGSHVSTTEAPDTRNDPMEPLYAYSLLHLKSAEEERRHKLEQYFATRDDVRRARRERIRRLRRWFTTVGASRPKIVELAAR